MASAARASCVQSTCKVAESTACDYPTQARPNLPLLLMCAAMFGLGVLVIALVVRRWLRRAEYKDLP